MQVYSYRDHLPDVVAYQTILWYKSCAPEVGEGQELALNSFSWGTFALHTPMESVVLLWLLESSHLHRARGREQK